MFGLKQTFINTTAALGILSGGATLASAQDNDQPLADFLGIKIAEEQTFSNKGTLTLIHQTCAEHTPPYLVCDLEVVSLQTLQSADFVSEYRLNDQTGQIDTSVRFVKSNDWQVSGGAEARKIIDRQNDSNPSWLVDNALAQNIPPSDDGRVVQNEVRLLKDVGEDALTISSLAPVNENFGFLITNRFNTKASDVVSFSVTPIMVEQGVISSAGANRDMTSEDMDYAQERLAVARESGGAVYKP